MDAAAPTTRYRTEDGEPAVDVRISSLEQLFDNRDPAPFLARDLDPSLVEYLHDSAEDLLGWDRVRVVFWLERPCPLHPIEEAYRSHFEFALDQLVRKRRRSRRFGEVQLLLALALIGLLNSVSPLVAGALPTWLGHGVGEGLLIFGWVLMWHPVETLLYDWIPARHERKVLTLLLSAALDVRQARTGPRASDEDERDCERPSDGAAEPVARGATLERS